MKEQTENKKDGAWAGGGSERKHLTGRKVDELLRAAKGSRNEARDCCLLLLIYRHGLRVSEACRLKLDQVDADSRVLLLPCTQIPDSRY
jgi:site-specific recombinase XerD